MDNKDRRKRLEDSLKEIRQRAIEMEEAIRLSRNLRDKDIEAQKRLIEETEEKLRLYRLVLAQMIAEQWAEKRHRRQGADKAPEDRVFAQASTGEEAEGLVPSIEERIFALNGKTREQTFESGSLIEKMRGYLCFKDDSGYLGSEAELSIKEQQQLTLSIKTKEDADKAQGYIREYENLCRFGEQLRFYFKRFQTCYSALAQLLNKWDELDEKAQRYTTELRRLQEIPTQDEVKTGKGVTLCFGSQDLKERAIKRDIQAYSEMEAEGAAFRYDKVKNIIFADVFTQGGLYERTIQEAKETEAAMADFKALALAAEQFIAKSELHYTPISIQMPTENAKEERYTRYLVKNLRYFRSEFLQKKSHTSEDRKRALIPDYYETKPNKDLYRDAKAILK